MTYLTAISPAGSSDEDPASPVTPDADEPPAQQWTAPKMAAFLRQLSATQSVAAAARSVGMSRQSAYKLRARLKGEPFDWAWKCAFRHNFDALAEAALDRALNGIEVPHFHKGELIHTSRRYDERLTVALLAMRGNLAATPAGPTAYIPEDLSVDNFPELVERVEQGPENWLPQRRGRRR
jgi:hypothetical protein